MTNSYQLQLHIIHIVEFQLTKKRGAMEFWGLTLHMHQMGI